MKDKISPIRQKMRNLGLSALIIPSEDPHKSEYVAEHWQKRKWLTGFSGSAGTAVLTMDKAILWTDFRYYIQAERQLAGSGFELFRMGEKKVPTVRKWLKENLKSANTIGDTTGNTIGIDGKVFSSAAVKELQKELSHKGIVLNTEMDIIGILWKDRPPRPQSQAFFLNDEFAGQSRADKLCIIREKMQAENAMYHILASLDDIAWILNLRGRDIHSSPVNIAYLIISMHRAVLFMDREKADTELENTLNSDGVVLKPYESIYKTLTQLPTKLNEDKSILIDPDNLNYSLFKAIPKDFTIIEKANPVIALKAVKNEIQIQHLRNTVIKDGVALVKFLYWLEHLEKEGQITEISAAEKLLSFREVQEYFVDNSFDTIMAYGEHSAMCHYSATSETDVIIGKDSLLLTDSGGNYLSGTTDITRTFCLDTPTPDQIFDYTLVLKSHIALATAIFPDNTRGVQLDTLARQHLWQQGMNFGHGTGHGVGFFLSVHEGPVSISPHPMGAKMDAKLEKGMVLTNEPGIYREGRYGIRLENMILVKPAFKNDFGSFMKFETLTLCHFEQNLIDKSLLSSEEINWINDYHALVYQKLSPQLESEESEWLKEKTRFLENNKEENNVRIKQ